MAWFPFQRFTLDTGLPADEAARRLEAAVEPVTWLRWAPGARPFEGVVVGRQFQLARIITYRNSFRPQVVGRVEPTAQGSRLVGVMRLHGGVAVVMVAWFVMVLAISVVTLAAPSAQAIEQRLFAPVGMFLFGWVMCVAAFTFEAARVQAALGRVLR
jgi:hypothetical protein